MVNGTNGASFHPVISKKERLYMFSSDLCRCDPLMGSNAKSNQCSSSGRSAAKTHGCTKKQSIGGGVRLCGDFKLKCTSGTRSHEEEVL